jgi:exodeoxyribonuclease VII small subunit
MKLKGILLSKKVNFEDSLNRLEEIANELESGELSLDDSLKYFEEGVKLSRFCEKKLTEVEQKLEILKSTDIPDDFDIDETHAMSTNDAGVKKKKSKDKSAGDDADLLF